MLELKHVSYSYQSYQEIFRRELSVQKWDIYSIIGQFWSRENRPSSPLGWSGQSQEGQVLFDGEDIQTKGSSYHRKHHVSLVFQNYN